MPKTFFITGVSTGLARGFAKAALDHGHKVVGTVRKEADRSEQLVESANPPTHLLLGTDAFEFVRREREAHGREILDWEAVTRSTDF